MEKSVASVSVCFGGTGPKRKRRKRVNPKGVPFLGEGYPIVLCVCLLGIILLRKCIPQFLSQI